MPWDGNQDVDPGTEEGELTPDEWEAMVADQKSHSGRHESGGSDELSVDGLSGVLADAQTPETEAVQDIVGALIQAGGNISVTYDDAGGTLTVDTSALNEEEVEDAVAALVTAGNAITVNYDDANDVLSIAVDESGLSFYDGTSLTAPVDNQSVSTADADIGQLTSGTFNGVNILTNYDTIQEAVDDTDSGGAIFVPEGIYTDGVWGTANVTDKLIHFISAGVGRSDNPFDSVHGAVFKLDNIGEPMIDYSSSNNLVSGPIFHNIAFHVTVDELGLRFTDVPGARLTNVEFFTRGVASTLLKFLGDSWRPRLTDVHLRRFTGDGMIFDGSGGGDGPQLYECQMNPDSSSGTDNSALVVRDATEPRIIGGIYGQNNNPAGTTNSIRFEGVEGGEIAARFNGSQEQIFLSDNDNGNPTQGVTMRNCQFESHAGIEHQVVFDAADTCVFTEPGMVRPSDGAEFAFNGNGGNCTVMASWNDLNGFEFEFNNDPFQPHIQFLEGAPAVSENQRDLISDPQPGMRVFNTDTSALNIYDGSGWVDATGNAV